MIWICSKYPMDSSLYFQTTCTCRYSLNRVFFLAGVIIMYGMLWLKNTEFRTNVCLISFPSVCSWLEQTEEKLWKYVHCWFGMSQITYHTSIKTRGPWAISLNWATIAKKRTLRYYHTYCLSFKWLLNKIVGISSDSTKKVNWKIFDIWALRYKILVVFSHTC